MGTDWIEHHLKQIGLDGKGEFSDEIRDICENMLDGKLEFKRVLTSVDEALETLNLTFLDIFQ